jgi:cytochrome c556
MRVTRLSWMWVCLSGLAGCGGATQTAAPAPAPVASASAEPAKPEPAPAAASAQPPPAGVAPGAEPKPDSPPPGASPTRLMHAHLTDALLIRKAVIAGTPEHAAAPAEALAKAENPADLPANWRASVERMQQIAGRINNSTSAAQAAGATADLGVACGGCHQTLGGPKASSEPPPPEGTTLTDRMQRHVWATERLWEGLTVPSADAWNAGVKALSASPFPPEVLKQGGVHGRSAAKDFTKLVVKAPSKKTVEERAALYAELLVTCGSCHRAINEAGSK